MVYYCFDHKWWLIGYDMGIILHILILPFGDKHNTAGWWGNRFPINVTCSTIKWHGMISKCEYECVVRLSMHICITIFVVYMRMHNVSDCYMYVMYCIINKHALRMYIYNIHTYIHIYIYTLYSICTFLSLAILLLYTPSIIAAKFHHIWWHLLESQRPQQVWSTKMLQTCGQTAEPSKTGSFATETIKNDSWTGRYPGTWQLQWWWCY